MIRNKYCRFFILISVIALFVLTCSQIPFNLLSTLEENTVLTRSEFNSILKNYDNFLCNASITAMADDNKTDTLNEYAIKYKLLNLFTIKNLNINVIEDDIYYAGGNCLGFSLKTKGLAIVGGNYVLTKSGRANPFLESGLKVGDIIVNINNTDISQIEDITLALLNYNGIDKINITVKRNNETITTTIKPVLDIQTGEYKLGLWVKDDALGVGTLTFYNDTTKRFGSLGHAITNSTNKSNIEVLSGEIYNCKVIGVKMGYNGVAGELLGTFSLNQESIGNIDKNCNFGVYGYITNNETIIEDKTPIELGGRVSVKPGKAKILSCIDSENIEEFDIEIIKTNYQKNENEKSMVIRVIDKELLSKTGGIVQGMSGSPIIQNGKLVGAVTHVFLNDASKGFGLYIDWMVNQ